MPDSTILNLAQGTTSDGTEWVPVVQGGQNVRLNFPGTAQQLSVDNGSMTVLTSTDVQGALSEIDTALGGAAMVFGGLVGTGASPEASSSASRPSTSLPVYWMMANGVTPSNAQDGDLIWNASA